jgi:hypothetical protein
MGRIQASFPIHDQHSGHHPPKKGVQTPARPQRLHAGTPCVMSSRVSDKTWIPKVMPKSAKTSESDQTLAVWRVFVANATASGGPGGSFPGDSVDVGTRDPDIGQFAVGRAAEFAKTSVITPPISVDFHKPP